MPEKMPSAGDRDESLLAANPIAKNMNSARFDQHLVVARSAEDVAAEDRTNIKTMHPRALCGK